ncbi:maleylpyruvate isomerase family mycothiol-dependent enzyme [Saccharopolyspora erythraea]|uniref:maleylpyruvate isomerase family mycothiol-dependent enzyme n=1 Tax=Saccharopolyspora erythraea TaxID=1836 RepID=UPI0020116019|nr:maleylpyruvate isomerase family mycothiol-dependent enzyme [Saccharopolyspora erythraea]
MARWLYRRPWIRVAWLGKSARTWDWDAPSLCAGWRVRDVVAHVVSYDELDGRSLARRFANGAFRSSRINAIGMAEYNARGTDELLAVLHRHLDPRGLPAAFGGMVAFLDGLIHHQDIRRALGRPREIPVERLLPALRCALLAPPIRGRARSRRSAGGDRPGRVVRPGTAGPRPGRGPAHDHGRPPRRGRGTFRARATQARRPRRRLAGEP